MPHYAVERTTLPMTAGSSNQVDIFAVEATNTLDAIEKLKAAIETTPDQIVKPLGYLDSKVVALFASTNAPVTLIYSRF